MAGSCLDVRFVSPVPVPPGNAGLQRGSGSHAGAWRSQGKPWRTGSEFMKQTSSVHSLSCMHTRIVTQRCQHCRRIIEAMLKTQSLSDQLLDHLALQRSYSRGQYHRLLIALLEGMETVQQGFFLREALPCR